jgi:hypothetical protein
MSKSKRTKPKVSGKFSFIPLDLEAQKRKFNLPVKRNLRAVGDLVASEYKPPVAVLPYLTLSAANTKTPARGWLNAVNCRNVHPEGPTIDFIPPDTSNAGKIEIWMENIAQGDSFAVQFRVLSANSGNWKISGSDLAQFQLQISQVAQSIEFLIPPVGNNYGSVFISLEPVFNSLGSWTFFDAIINKVSY